jgi:hypothetical protein
LEYEYAVQLNRVILIYLADEQQAKVRYVDVDVEPALREKLKAFKATLRERHTVDTFSGPEDLVEKLRRDLARYFQPTKTKPPEEPNDEFAETLKMVQRFLLLPKTVLGREVRFRVSFYGDPYPASRDLCKAFNLDYGSTIGTAIGVQEPRLSTSEAVPFRELYADVARADKLIELASDNEVKDVYARLQFAENDVKQIRGVFFGYSYYDDGEDQGNPFEYYVAPEGKAILLFSKMAS